MEASSGVLTAEYRRQPRPLLVVEDSDEDYSAFCRALGNFPVTGPVFRCQDGDDCLDYLRRSGKYRGTNGERPSLILLDLNLPGTDGREVLAILDSDEALRAIPVVVVTTSTNPEDVELCYRYGANSYFNKTHDWKRFVENVRLLLSYWFTAVVLPSHIA